MWFMLCNKTIKCPASEHLMSFLIDNVNLSYLLNSSTLKLIQEEAICCRGDEDEQFPYAIHGASLPCPFTSASSLHSVFVLLLDSPHLDATQILLCKLDSVQLHPKPSQSKTSLSLALFCFAPWSQSPISAVAHVRETVHVAKCLNPLLLCFCWPCLAIPPHSYISGCPHFPPLIVWLVWNDDSVLRKGEYHNRKAAMVELSQTH